MEQNLRFAKSLMDGTPLADIRDVFVDSKLSRDERIAEFLRQIKNPYLYGLMAFQPGFYPHL